MPVFGSFSVRIGPKTKKSKVESRPVSIDDSSCVHLGAKLIYHLEGRCSIQLSYGRNQLVCINLQALKYTQLNNSTRPFDTRRVKERNKGKKPLWQKTQSIDLSRYIPSKTYFARISIGCKLIVWRLKASVHQCSSVYRFALG